MLIILSDVELAAAMSPVNNVGCACQGARETGWRALLEKHPQKAGGLPGRGNLNRTLLRRNRLRLREIQHRAKKQSVPVEGVDRALRVCTTRGAVNQDMPVGESGHGGPCMPPVSK